MVLSQILSRRLWENQGRIKPIVELLVAIDGLSKDVYEIVSKSLKNA